MTQKDKELLLKDLCGRLPYGVIVQISLFRNDGRKRDIDLDPHVTENIWEIIDNYQALPYLRPLSSMTDEEMDMLFDILHIDKDGKDDDWIKINDVYGIKFFFPTGRWVENVAEAYDYLNSIHIDYRGLIPMGLAIAVTEENNPYESTNKAH